MQMWEGASMRCLWVLVEQVNAVGPEPLQRRLGNGPDVLGPAVQARLDLSALEAELGGDHDLVTDGRERFADGGSRSLPTPGPGQI